MNPDNPDSVSVHPDPLLPGVRRLIWIIFLLAVANGLFLYLLPSAAEKHYAWAVKPPINAAFMGAGYLAGMVATALALFRTRFYRSVRVIIWPFVILTVTLLAATLIHRDRFFWSYPLTWLWTAVYVTVPCLLVVIWFVQERVAGTAPVRDGRLTTVRAVCLVPGLAFFVLGAVMALAPSALVGSWPWPITPLLSRCLGAWYMFAGALLLATTVSARRLNEVFLPSLTLVIWGVLILLLPLLHSAAINTGTLSFGLWLALHLIGLVVSAFALWKVMARRAEWSL